MMEIKGIGGFVSAYKTTTASAPKKTSAAAVSAKNNTDRVEFGFAAAIAAAKAEIANEVKADAAPQEILDAGNSAEDYSAEKLAALILVV